jgi:membrane-associated protein
VGVAALIPELIPLFMGIDWLDPDWLLRRFDAEFVWVCLLIIFVECGLFFPFLPGDALLFAIGVFIGTGNVDLLPGHPWFDLVTVMGLLIVAAFAGNVCGYEIGRKLGPSIYQHDGRILKRKHLVQTEEFFEKHGPKALVIGRFVAFVRNFVLALWASLVRANAELSSSFLDHI